MEVEGYVSTVGFTQDGHLLPTENDTDLGDARVNQEIRAVG
jgi:hypothetical protein